MPDGKTTKAQSARRHQRQKQGQRAIEWLREGAPQRVVPPAIQRLMDEVRQGDATPRGLFDRAHNRHNR
jgi:hypothetical protein